MSLSVVQYGSIYTATCADNYAAATLVNIYQDGVELYSSPSTATGYYTWAPSAGPHTISCNGYHGNSTPILDGSASTNINTP